jgi:hypothetical protein
MKAFYYMDERRYSPAGPSVHFYSEGPGTGAASAGRYTPSAQQSDQFSEYELYDISDWDSYDAAPITAETVNVARRFYNSLPRSAGKPDIAPGNDGTIGFEWRSGPPSDRTIIFIEVGPGNVIRASRYRAGHPVQRLGQASLGTGVANLLYAVFSSE